MSIRRLTRPRTERKLAGVCAGLAEYFNVDVVLVRVAWVVLSIVPGAIVGGLLAYAAAWLIVPERADENPVVEGRRLLRSTTDKKIAGVCGGLADYFGVDATPIRLAWIVLSIVCGAGIGGVLAYLVAWFIIPRRPAAVLSTPAQAPVG